MDFLISDGAHRKKTGTFAWTEGAGALLIDATRCGLNRCPHPGPRTQTLLTPSPPKIHNRDSNTLKLKAEATANQPGSFARKARHTSQKGSLTILVSSPKNPRHFPHFDQLSSRGACPRMKLAKAARPRIMGLYTPGN